jgi:hypothetical protein
MKIVPISLPLLIAVPILRWDSPRVLPAAIAIACGLAVAVVWFYPAQVRYVRRPWRWVMPGCRVAALVVLALSLARPVAIRVEAVGQGGTVVILIDRSASMNVADAGRGPAELVALADSLGLLPPSVRGGARPGPVEVARPLTVEGGRSEPTGAATRPARANPGPPDLGQLIATFGEIRSTAQQAFRAQGDLDYSRVSGQGIEAAQARLSELIARLAPLGNSLAGQAKAALPVDGFRAKLTVLAKLPPIDARGTWVKVLKPRIDQAGSALSDYQAAKNTLLYRSNPEVKEICDALAHYTRFQLACSALLRPDDGLVARLINKTPVSGFAFADDLTPLGPLHPNPAAALAPPAGPATPMGDMPDPPGSLDPPGSDDDPTRQPAGDNGSPLPAV